MAVSEKARRLIDRYYIAVSDYWDQRVDNALSPFQLRKRTESAAALRGYIERLERVAEAARPFGEGKIGSDEYFMLVMHLSHALSALDEVK